MMTVSTSNKEIRVPVPAQVAIERDIHLMPIILEEYIGTKS